ncbi:hypothetical protein [Mariniblastus fucicola]|uniref:Uncharacterized protein n=1 Tax=Mariniblastus fucicola TaxID=980251 RepID=A0A5B9PFH2_9BACT|nr:hypothetical protein [Mariniblastus fucicola]QEG21711.1 hypothetical protein MFFC18_15700 [Mariniblastus fucicola]
MRSLFFSIGLMAILAVGCGEQSTVESGKGNTQGASAVDGGIVLDEVDADGLEAAVAANEITLVDFTAVW